MPDLTMSLWHTQISFELAMFTSSISNCAIFARTYYPPQFPSGTSLPAPTFSPQNVKPFRPQPFICKPRMTAPPLARSPTRGYQMQWKTDLYPRKIRSFFRSTHMQRHGRFPSRIAHAWTSWACIMRLHLQTTQPSNLRSRKGFSTTAAATSSPL